jgi:hypothetical protein
VGFAVKVTKGDGENATTERVSGDLESSSLVAGGQGGDADVENAGHMNVVPFFLDESMLTKRTPPGMSIYSEVTGHKGPLVKLSTKAERQKGEKVLSLSARGVTLLTFSWSSVPSS